MTYLGVQSGEPDKFDFTTTKIQGNGTVGPYTIPTVPRGGRFSTTGPEDNIDVWVGQLYQERGKWTLSGATITFDSVVKTTQEIIIKYRNQALVVGTITENSVHAAELADDAVALTSFSNQTVTGEAHFLGWDENGEAAVIQDVATSPQNRFNIAANAFRIARTNSFTWQNMTDGFADEFIDETGIDTGASSNEVYNAGLGGYYNTASAEMLLISNAVTSNNANPTRAFVMLSYEAIDPTDPNSDIACDVSRDGTTWTRVNLIDSGATRSGVNLLTGSVDISSQPLGSNMKYRIRMLNSKDQRLHAVSFQWR